VRCRPKERRPKCPAWPKPQPQQQRSRRRTVDTQMETLTVETSIEDGAQKSEQGKELQLFWPLTNFMLSLVVLGLWFVCIHLKLGALFDVEFGQLASFYTVKINVERVMTHPKGFQLKAALTNAANIAVSSWRCWLLTFWRLNSCRLMAMVIFLYFPILFCLILFISVVACKTHLTRASAFSGNLIRFLCKNQLKCGFPSRSTKAINQL